ncbi:MAG: hypothetical protein H6Q14_2588 [Bacteroidetes bacterium]|nr:hypothetical protein [Bacteroidota bacterium]
MIRGTTDSDGLTMPAITDGTVLGMEVITLGTTAHTMEVATTMEEDTVLMEEGAVTMRMEKQGVLQAAEDMRLQERVPELVLQLTAEEDQALIAQQTTIDQLMEEDMFTEDLQALHPMSLSQVCALAQVDLRMQRQEAAKIPVMFIAVLQHPTSLHRILVELIRHLQQEVALPIQHHQAPAVAVAVALEEADAQAVDEDSLLVTTKKV